jgi:hypothetical protein
MRFLKKFNRLSRDETSKPSSQVEFLMDFLSNHNFVFSENFEENLEILKKKHLVDSFVVTNFDGSIVVSSDPDAQSKAIMGTAMLSYIRSEISSSETVLIKKDSCWLMLFSLNKKVFIVEAGSELSSIELNALALELSMLLEQNKEVLKKTKEVEKV